MQTLPLELSVCWKGVVGRKPSSEKETTNLAMELESSVSSKHLPTAHTHMQLKVLKDLARMYLEK